MATVPNQDTVVPGVATSTYANKNIRDAVNWCTGDRDRALLRQTVLESLTTSGTWQDVTFDTEDLDNNGAHSTVTNTARFVAVNPGWYRCSGSVSFASHADTGRRCTRWAVNGSPINGSSTKIPCASLGSVVGVGGVSRKIFLNVGDYITLQAMHEAGVALNTSVTGDEQSTMDVDWEGR